MICCNRHRCCDYCPCCGRYLGPWRPWVPPYAYPWYYPKPYDPPCPPPPRPFWDTRDAVREGHHALGAR